MNLLLRIAATLSISLLPAPHARAGREAFVEEHCIDCHDASTRKAGLDLNRLAAPGREASEDAVWERIHDRVASGEMPPARKQRPAAPQQDVFLKEIASDLVRGVQQRRAKFGRSPLRRMNRTEYEATLHDLLGITVPLKDLLPEDNPIAGYDRVGRGLETSSLHLVRYQHAAERALDAAVPAYPVASVTRRWSGLQFFESRPKSNQAGTRPFVRFSGDSILFAARTYKHGSITTPAVTTPGRYRIRASVEAVNTEGRPLPVLFGRISSDRFQHEKLEHILGFHDALPGQRRVLEVESDLPRGEQIYLEGTTLPFFQNFSKARNNTPVEDAYNGPCLAVDWIEIEGPLAGNGGYRRIFGDLPWLPARYVADQLAGKPIRDDWKKWPVNGANSEYTNHPLTAFSSEPREDAERLLRAFLSSAFRRPVPEPLFAEYLATFERSLAGGVGFDAALRETCKAALCSPHFLIFLETPGKLDAHALACRLSRLFWSSMPDEALRAAADSGDLLRPQTLAAETDRLMNAPKARRFLEDFAGQWLDLRRFLEMKPDDLYTEYDEALAWSMPAETRCFFTNMLAHNRPVTDLVASDWTFLNGRLAKHYGLGADDHMELVHTSLPPGTQRGGVITQAAILKVTTNASYTSPVKRGAWILEKILGQTPPAPPADVAAVDPDIRGAVTLREQLALHKNDTSCAACHRWIDPPGFALENFDVLGGWRDFYRVRQPPKGGWRDDLPNYPGHKAWFARPVEAWGETADGVAFGDIHGYRKALLRDPEQLTRNMVRQFLVYATGEPVSFADRTEVERIVRAATQKGAGLRTILHEVVQSPLFCEK